MNLHEKSLIHSILLSRNLHYKIRFIRRSLPRNLHKSLIHSQIVAEETLTNPRLSSTATVVVSVSDTNDNPPKFDQEAYTAVVSETASPGTVVTTIVASDRDTGQFGADGIKYSLFGNGAEK